MKDAGKGKDVPFTWKGIRCVLGKWHFWVYTAYYTSDTLLFHIWVSVLTRTQVLHMQREHRILHESMVEELG